MALVDTSRIDYMVLNRLGAQFTKRISQLLVPTELQKNPAFETYIWFVETIENLTLNDLIEMIKNFPATYLVWWKGLYEEAPTHLLIETAMIIWIVWLLFIRKTADPKSKVKDANLTDKDIKWLVKTWEPEPLIPELTSEQQLRNSHLHEVTGVAGKNGRYLKIKGVKKNVLNMTSFDYLGLTNFPSVKSKITAALNKYGCGSCGPRGFYGTIDVHLEFEETFAKYMGVEESIAYSDSASGITSAISAFAKKGDLIIMDEGCYEAIRTGAKLSRATVRTFKHNDTNDLRNVLEGIAAEDKKKRRDASQQRRFIITEGVFRNTGEICPLPSIMALKEKFSYRMILDDSHSFGTLGATGKGVTEYYGIPISDVEIISIAMDNVLGSVGGVCIGSREVVDHQRLMGPGYCFSASACPFLSVAAVTALKELEQNPQLVKSLAKNSKALNAAVSKIKGLRIKGKSEQTDSPIIHLCIDPDLSHSKEKCKSIVIDIAKRCVDMGTGVATCKFSLTDITSLAPSIRLTSNAFLTKEEIDETVANLKAATAVALKAARGGDDSSTPFKFF